MDIDFDGESWLPAVDRQSARPEWHALRTRLHAAYEASRAMRLRAACGTLDTCGSFAPAAADALDGFERGLTAVNPDVSANGKTSASMNAGGNAGADIADEQRRSRVR